MLCKIYCKLQQNTSANPSLFIVVTFLYVIYLYCIVYGSI